MNQHTHVFLVIAPDGRVILGSLDADKAFKEADRINREGVSMRGHIVRRVALTA